jgi:hypothetical protein
VRSLGAALCLLWLSAPVKSAAWISINGAVNQRYTSALSWFWPAIAAQNGLTVTAYAEVDWKYPGLFRGRDDRRFARDHVFMSVD